MFTTSKGYTVETIKKELREQLTRYHWEFKGGDNAFQEKTSRLTGKISGAQDDLAISLLMLSYWPKIYMAKNRK